MYYILNSITIKYQDCTIAQKKDFIDMFIKSEIARRATYYDMSITEEINLPWYFKTEYIINEYIPCDSLHLDFCPYCGKIDKHAKCIKETRYYAHTCTMKCICNKFYEIQG